MSRSPLLLAALAAACSPGGADSAAGDSAWVQPGLDDPTARQWTLAGEWYPEDPLELDEDVAGRIARADATARPVRALITPHAGIAYSGDMAARAWARADVPRTVVILGPNHYADGEEAAIWTEGPWLVPGHAIAIDDALTARLQELDPSLISDRAAFGHHEIEMNLPFLQLVRPDARMVVAAWRDNQDWDFRDFDLDQIEASGRAVAQLISEAEADGTEVLLVLTVDLVHYVSLAQAEEEDPILLEHIETLDVEGLYEDVQEQGLSICAEVSTAVGMVALRELGVDRFDWLDRTTSYDRSGDPDWVVGYPAGVVYR